MKRTALLLALILAACGGGESTTESQADGATGGTERSYPEPALGYQEIVVHLIEGSPSQAAYVASDPPECIIWTDWPMDWESDGSAPPGARHVGREVWRCLEGEATQISSAPYSGWYRSKVWYRVREGKCPEEEGFTFWACHSDRQWPPRINIEVEHIGYNHICEHGTPFPEGYDKQCWERFYEVMGHETAHLPYGVYHPDPRDKHEAQ